MQTNFSSLSKTQNTDSHNTIYENQPAKYKTPHTKVATHKGSNNKQQTNNNIITALELTVA